MDNIDQLIKCEYCEGKFNERMRMCPFCNGEHKKPISNDDLICPRCRSFLKVYNYRSEKLNICPKCSGIWLDTSEFKHLTSERDVYKDDSTSKEYLKKPLNDEVKYSKCLRCNSFMKREMFKKISGVIIDICRDHGVWLDAGELEQIRSFIANGGLEKYMDYMDSKISKNHRDIRKLAGEVDKVKFIQKMTHLYKPRYWLFRLFF